MTAPATFGVEFLDWVKDRTEAYWRLVDEPALADYQERGTGGAHWRRGTRWFGYTDTEIDAFEKREGLTFPLDYRLFLRRLGRTDRPRGGAHFIDESRMTSDESPGFYDWSDESQIANARDDVAHGFVFDVEHNALWRDEWGPRPDDAPSRERALRAAIAAAPRLAPIFGHRYLVLEPATVGNPVLSIHQSDLIVYGADLRRYLLNELVDELGTSHDFDDPSFEAHAAIPFWGEFLS